ncbi:hypothetical protein EV363DRAFT_1353648 [Boletus edulis]|nr:hypothetical protein EV363DRAFT_1353648 [Boletus edulis]
MSWLNAKDLATGVEYSSLFHSGLRAISLRPRASRSRRCSSSSSSQKGWSGDTSSTASLSSKRSRARTRYPSPAPPSPATRVTRPRPSSMFVRPTKDTLFEVGDYTRFSEEQRLRAGHLLPPVELDGLRSLAVSQPLFVNLGEMDATGDESFLSLSNPTDGFLQHAVPRHERPVLIQPMSSRRSSLHRRTRETRRERSDCAWMLEECSPELKAYDSGNEVEEIWLDGDRDWRQFHVDLVQNMR